MIWTCLKRLESRNLAALELIEAWSVQIAKQQPLVFVTWDDALWVSCSLVSQDVDLENKKASPSSTFASCLIRCFVLWYVVSSLARGISGLKLDNIGQVFCDGDLELDYDHLLVAAGPLFFGSGVTVSWQSRDSFVRVSACVNAEHWQQWSRRPVEGQSKTMNFEFLLFYMFHCS